MGCAPLVIKGLPAKEYYRQWRLANPAACAKYSARKSARSKATRKLKSNPRHHSGLWPRQMTASEFRLYRRWQPTSKDGDVFPAGWSKPAPKRGGRAKLPPDVLAARKKANNERYKRAKGVKPIDAHREALFFKTWGQREARDDLRKLQAAERMHGQWWSWYADRIGRPGRIEAWELWQAEALRNPVLFLWCREQLRRTAKRAAKRRARNKPGTKTFLAQRIRRRLQRSIKDGRGMKSGKSREILGCDWQFLRDHLEARFTRGMTWENYGYHGWHIDHIVPLCRFDLRDPEQVKKAWHYTNLQPLWAWENYAKLAS